MADFINTIDVLGDSATTDSILARTITEFKDDTITTIGTGAFNKCTELTIVVLPKCSEIRPTAFTSCTALKAVILPGNEVCKLTSTNAFNITSIPKGTGYIYVPAALVDSYKAASQWSTFAAQFRALEDYTVDGTVDGELDENKI